MGRGDESGTRLSFRNLLSPLLSTLTNHLYMQFFDIGVIDVETCRPLPNVLVDIWHANATGQYAGHPTPLPGLEDEKPQVGGKFGGLLTTYPRLNYEETFLRGAWVTDANGVAKFTTVFPGYYTGRAVHVHCGWLSSSMSHEAGRAGNGKKRNGEEKDSES